MGTHNAQNFQHVIGYLNKTGMKSLIDSRNM
jgi:hypothetical protein